MENFQAFNLHKDLNSSLNKVKFTKPTEIQEKAIPSILQGKDVLGSAHTGTGKTAAFCIPLIHFILKGECKRAMILAPTRELAKQIETVVFSLTQKKSPIKSLSLVGGEPMNKQLSKLKSKPQIIIGTPGRVTDHLKRKSLNLSQLNFLVLDEMDRMLDMGFSIQINEILNFIPEQKQTLMFSATISKSIEKLSSKYLDKPVRVSVDSNNNIPKIDQKVISLTKDEKFPQLTKHIQENYGLMLVFVKTKRGAKNLAKDLSKLKIQADAIHGDLRQHKRATVIKKFRNGKIQVLVATDVAARGLDIPNIDDVINYDLPQQAEDFIHRIGRTGRAGAKGTAWSYVTKSDGRKWREIENILYPGKKTMFNDTKNKSSKGSKNRRDKNKKTKFSEKKNKKFKNKKEDGFSNEKRDRKFNKKRGKFSRDQRDKKFDTKRDKFSKDKKGKTFRGKKGKFSQDKNKTSDSKKDRFSKDRKSKFKTGSKFSKKKNFKTKKFNKKNRFKSKNKKR